MNNYSLDHLNCLINGLIFKNVIQSKSVESALRCVSRDFYNITKNRPNASFDAQVDKIHSVPIYAEVLEYLSLRPGDKFLNIGCGVGYLNTVAGLLIGSNGVNHGVEIVQTDVEFAYQKLAQFKLNAAAIDYFDFCEPIFAHGNIFDATPTAFYDKIFCEGAITSTQDMFIRSFLKVGGMLIVPIHHTFFKITRISIDSWDTVHLSWILVSPMIEANKLNAMPPAEFPTVQPRNLDDICRSTIRLALRDFLMAKFPHFKILTKCTKQYSEQCVIQHSNGAYEARGMNIILNTLQQTEFENVPAIPETDNDIVNELVDRELNWLRFPKVLSVYFRQSTHGNYPAGAERPLKTKRDKDSKKAIINVIKASSSEYNVVLERSANKFSKSLRETINELPLPSKLICFLNNDKDD
ncbi:protein-L-isoaspartate O-methyltransferase domain-containing protein 1-like [Adelges cooleyi]|uniref:protein-L-isoaspartate O-methyltransferase domain-containing protein 1-like n=1 Tax=Adelges cooleyi TaxID=133065 RepID=UPI00217FB41E|nr:protein-L-isoaspartate O-methyltransferase domain-containing protein 1-like [Adelges cooleyi]